MSRSFAIVLLALAVTLAGGPKTANAHERNTLVPRGHSEYKPSPIPDRVMLTLTEIPENSQSVNWRTNGRVEKSIAQITEAHGRPGLHLTARTVEGTHQEIKSENG